MGGPIHELGLVDIQSDAYDRDPHLHAVNGAADEDAATPEKAVTGLQGWVDCFEKAEFAGSLFCGGISDPGEADRKDTEKNEAYQFGKALE